jgi:hypothetical protein
MPGLILAAACGALSALCFAYLAAETGFYLHTLSVMVVVPIGGVLAGSAAGFGLAVGVQAVTAEDTRRNYWTAVLLGPATYLALYWWLWGMEASDAPFWYWVRASVSDSMRSFFFGLGRPVPGIPAAELSWPFAALAWARFLAQFMGAALGSFLAFHLVARQLEPCPACRKAYRSPKTLFNAPTGDGAEIIARFRELKGPEAVSAWLAEGRSGAAPVPAMGANHLAVRLIRCSRADCGTARLSAGLRVTIATGDFSVGREATLELRRDLVRLLDT